jgi:hypothetical protein
MDQKLVLANLLRVGRRAERIIGCRAMNGERKIKSCYKEEVRLSLE